jgi:hypothetical protein
VSSFTPGSGPDEQVAAKLSPRECRHRWIAYGCGCRECSVCGHQTVCATWRYDDLRHLTGAQRV